MQRRNVAVSLAAAAVVVAGAGVLTALPASAATGCKVAYTTSGEWPGGFGANVTITNLGDPIKSWTLGWSFAPGQTVSQAWNATVTQAGSQVSARNVDWNSSVANGSTASFGFTGTWTAANPAPSTFTLNGTACTGAEPPMPGPSNPPAPPAPPNPAPSMPATAAPNPPTENPPTQNPPTQNQPAGNGVPADAAWVGSGQWDTWTGNGYTLYNDVWGSGAGAQTIWARSGTNFGVLASHPRTSGVKSYANTEKVINRKLSSMKSITSSFDTTVPADGDYEATYDLWADNNAYEIMIWTNQHGAVGPIADAYDGNGAVPKVRNLNVGGHTWNVYRGSNGANAVYSFVRANTNSGTVDLLAILNWLRTNGWWGDVTLGQFQYGFEISGTAGSNSPFTLNKYSLDFS